MSSSEFERYQPKGDFGAYNEPSWVPNGYCKCCATKRNDQGLEVRKTAPELTKLVARSEVTSKKNLAILQCPNCDHTSDHEQN